MNSSGNLTEQSCLQSLPVGHGVALVIINSLASIAGTMGNILVCLAVIANSRRHRNTNSYLLASLAIADLVVTVFAQPLVVAMVIKRAFFHQCAQLLDELYTASSYLSCSSSLCHLAMISIDRAGAVLRPVQHIAFMKASGWKIFIGISWGVATAFCLTGQLLKGSKEVAYIASSLFFVSYTVVITCYSLILIRLRKEGRKWTGSKRKHSSTTDAQVEKRVATTIAIVIAIFTVCWLPMIVTFFAKGQPLIQVNGPAFMWIRTLFLCNSSMNFIIYTWRLREFRQALWEIIRCKTLKHECRSSDVISMNEQRSV